MNILIVSATSIEIKHLIAVLKHKPSQPHERKSYDGKLNRFSYDSHNIDVLITGIGMVQTAFWLGKTLETNTYDMSFNFGIAGSFDKSIKPGDIVHITSDCFSELGAEDGKNFIKIQDLQILGNIKVNNTFTNNLPINNPVINKLKKVKGITVNTIHGEKSSIKKIKQLYDPDVESMEGATFLYACLTEKIPNAQIRAISNYVEERNKNLWKTKSAIENLNKIAIEILDNIE